MAARTCLWILAIAALLIVSGCDSDTKPTTLPSATDNGTFSDTGGAGTDAVTDTTVSTTDTPVVDAMTPDSGPSPDMSEPDEGDPAMPGPPALKAYSGGQCPNLAAGSQNIQSAGQNRRVAINLPPNPAGAGVAFLWHGLGDSPENFSAAVGAAGVANQHNIITVAPEAIEVLVPGMPATWGLLGAPGNDLSLFDDTLACLEAQYDIDERRVFVMGFSAGALWSSLLVIQRSEYLTAATLFSGGSSATGMVSVDYSKPGHTLPVLLTWGGDTDTWGGGMLNFKIGSTDLFEKLLADGHPAVGCDHGGGHTVPYGGTNWGWAFLFAHEYADGESPYWGYAGTDYPDYCVFPTPP